jgi:DNA repair ATPase RecN
LVAHSTDGKIETVYYQFLAPMLLNEYQKQQRTLQAQAQELKKQTAEIAKLKREAAEVAKLKEEMERMSNVLARLDRAQTIAASSRYDPRKGERP